MIVGGEALLVDREIGRIVAAVRAAAGDEEVSVRDLRGGDVSEDTLADLFAPSLFPERRVIVLRELQDVGKDAASALAAAIGAADDETVVVAAHAGGAKGKAALEALSALGRTREVASVRSPREREQFVADEVRAAGGTIDREAAAELVAAVGNDVRELAIVCRQLVADVGPAIGIDEVTTYHRGRVESTGFAVADRAVDGDAAGALETLRWAFATGLDPVLVSSSLAANLRLIAQVGAAGGGSADALSRRLAMPAWKIRRAQAWLRRWRPDALATAVQAVAVADGELKGAGDDAAYAVERAVLLVAAAGDRS